MSNIFNSIKAVFLDLDDTLCNFSDAAREARLEAFLLISERKPDITPSDAYKIYMHHFNVIYKDVVSGGVWRRPYLISGKSTRDETMRRVALDCGIEDDGFAEQMSEKYDRLRRSKLKLIDSALEVITELKKRFYFGVITNGPADVQRDELQVLGLTDLFDKIVIEGEYGRGKPDKSIFDYALEGANALPIEAVYCGDSFNNDVVGAVNAGWNAIWYNPSGAPSPQKLPANTAVITSLTQISGIVG